MLTHTARIALLFPPLLLLHGQADAEAGPRGTYVQADLDRVDVIWPGDPLTHSSNVVFLNGCFGTGCDISPGSDDSVSNTSTIPQSTSHIPPFSGGQMQWDAIVECVRDTYAPFDIVITDVDPGDAPHFEAIVAGQPTDVGMPNGVGGVAPFACGGVINNAITFSFAEVFENEVAETCWTVAQETAHAFGLDHEYLCSDPMTYLQSCDPNKRFEDQEAPCGEYQARACQCNGNTQNSYQTLLDHFGPGIPTPPSLAITEPSNGAEVEAGFVVRATAEDDIRVDRIELRINHILVGTAASAPYVFDVPDTVSEGRLTLELTAYDNYDYATTEVIEVVRGELCRKSADCADLEACVDGGCIPGPGAEGGLGQTCTSNGQCASNLCGRSSEGDFCSETCEPGGNGCPGGFGCLDTGDKSVCWPGAGSSGGCEIAGSDHGPLLPWLLALGLLALRRRRRRF